MNKTLLAAGILAGLVACGSAPENDTVYQALRANPPTEIPERHLEKLRQGRFSCDVREEGTARQYMTCWWPGSRTAILTYYGGGLRRPSPDKIIAPGGKPISSRIPIS